MYMYALNKQFIVDFPQFVILFFSRAVNAQQIDTYQLKSLDGQFGEGIIINIIMLKLRSAAGLKSRAL